MTFLAAPVWNQIADQQPLESEAAKVSFRLNPEQLARLDDLWMKAETEAGTPPAVARCLPTCLPLLTESQAIAAYVSQHPNLKGALPEMLDADEASELMTQDCRLSPENREILTRILSEPQPALERWHQAALAAMNAP